VFVFNLLRYTLDLIRGGLCAWDAACMPIIRYTETSSLC